MIRFVLGAAAAAFAASTPALAQVPPTVSASPPAAAANSINRMQRAAKPPKSRAEVQAAVARQFARTDANRDGFVTKAEADALQAMRSERREQRAANKDTRRQQRAANNDMRREQRAANKAARRDPAAMFGRLDANNDGSITQAEAEAARTARVAAKGKPARANAVAFGGLFDRADVNRDGNITRAEFAAAVPRGRMPRGKRDGVRNAGDGPRGAGRMIERRDADKDGRMSLAEAQQAALARFDRSDLNRDGLVSQEERRQSRQQRRALRQPG